MKQRACTGLPNAHAVLGILQRLQTELVPDLILLTVLVPDCKGQYLLLGFLHII